MKQTTLKSLKDNARFKLSKRGVTYKLTRKDKKTKTATYQSCNSDRTFEASWNNHVFVIE